MTKIYKMNSLKFYTIYVIFILLSLTLIQKKNNALPFFYKDYPTYQANGKEAFDSVSESLVLNRIDFSTLHINYNYGFNLWRSNQEVRSFTDYRDNKNFDIEFKTNSDYLLDGKPYKSQIGAQSLVYAKFAEISNGAHGNYSTLKFISVLLLSLFSAIIFLWIRFNFGNIPALTGILFFTLSTGINIFSESLYWSIWIFIAPLSLACLLELSNIRHKLIVFLSLFPLFLFKFLSGYEFITTITLSAMTPYAWSFFINKNFSSFVRATVVGCSSGAAFIVSIFLYDYYFSNDFSSSGISNILERSGSWSVRNLGDLDINPHLQFMKILIMNFLDINGYGIPLGFIAIAFIGCLIYLRRIISDSDIKFILFLFIGSVSWFSVQPGHILFHPRYATLMFFIPFGLFAPAFLMSLFYKKG